MRGRLREKEPQEWYQLRLFPIMLPSAALGGDSQDGSFAESNCRKSFGR